MPINFFRHIYTPDNALITRISPPESLMDFVEGFYLFKTQDLYGRQLFFNDGYPVITLMQRSESEMRINLSGGVINIGNAWVCGGLLKNIYCESSINTEEFFVIRFNPITFFKLFNIRENVFKHKPVLARLITTFIAMPLLSIKLKQQLTFYPKGSVQPRFQSY
jgi:hypothetical protein